jgi:putative hydroxymethylpyrimidine transporter CytX
MATAPSAPPIAPARPVVSGHAEVPLTLTEPAPQPLGFLDQMGLWGNLGVSLLGFTGAIFVLQPLGEGTATLSLLAALIAILLGTLLGTLALALSAVPGARTGAPAMVLLRGLFGARVSYLPTGLNIIQCLGWGIFEIVTIAAAAKTVAPSVPRWVFILLAGAITTALTMRPLGSIRVLRKYVTVAVVVVLTYLFIQLLRHPLPPLNKGTWSGFWVAVDSTVAVAVSFVPLAADYTRHSRSPRVAFGATLIGYTTAQTACYVLGLLALLTVARTPDDIYGAFIAVPLGSLAFGVLALRELDQSFANVYSTAVSVQNVRPRWDRRVLALVIGVATTTLALWFDVSNYQDFLLLLGSVFVPMFGVLVVDFFVISGDRWDLSVASPSRWTNLVPWACGFVAYQIVNPGYLSWWSSGWQAINRDLHISVPNWMSASVTSFVVAAVVTLVIGGARRLWGSRRHRASA